MKNRDLPAIKIYNRIVRLLHYLMTDKLILLWEFGVASLRSQ